MELDFIAAIPVAIVRVQHGRILIRQRAPLDRLRRAEGSPVLFDLGTGPARAIASHCLAQRSIGGEQVVIHQRRRLIQNLMIHVLYLTMNARARRYSPSSPSC